MPNLEPDRRKAGEEQRDNGHDLKGVQAEEMGHAQITAHGAPAHNRQTGSAVGHTHGMRADDRR